MSQFKYDVIGYWSEIKLDIVNQYARQYSKIVKRWPLYRSHLYIDAFAGPGQHISRTTGEMVPGSPLNALLIQPPFSEYHLIDIDGKKTTELARLVGERPDVRIYEGDANVILMDKVFPRCRFEDYARALCLLDPYALTVDWQVIAAAGKMKTIEIFFNLMMMDINMNVLKRNPDRVDEAQIKRMDKAWGDHSWRDISYTKERGLFGDMEQKIDNETLAKAFQVRLKEVAGFEYVPAPMPMRNEQGAIIYYLYFASPNKTGHKIVSHIFDAYRNKGVR
jgi:three-Cys-motif partner protein